MSTTWFTSDEHFGHYNILRYSQRPFATLEEMDKEIIRRHNEVVGPEDTVVHLGDFTLRRNWRSAAGYFDRLKGQNHIFIPGSHDSWMNQMSGISGFSLPFYREEGTPVTGHGILAPMLFSIRCGKQEFICCHYSLRTWPKSHYGTIHLYGHSHGRLPGLGRSMDVGVDCTNFYPLSAEQIVERMQGIVAHNAVKDNTVNLETG